jgi:hypothetical protein
MGTQQLLLIILGVVIIGVAMIVGLSLFAAHAVQSNKDEIIHDINNIATYTYQYRMRPTVMGGGQDSYVNCVLPSKFASNDNAVYSLSGASATAIVITGTSTVPGNGYIVGTVDDVGNVTIDDSHFNQ